MADLFKLFVDPGHGGSDPGAVGNGLKEKDLTLIIAKRIREILANEYVGVAVKMSCTGDTFPTLKQRTDDANNWGAHFFLSIHINSGGGTGFETFSYPGTTKTYQNPIHDEILKVSGLKDRGKKQQDFHVIRESKMPAVLTESGFIDNANDSAKMKDSAWLESICRAHVNGLEKAFNIKRKVVVHPKPTESKSTPTPSTPSIVYEAHVQDIGWQGPKRNGETAGTTGHYKRLEALTVKLENLDAHLEMQAHIQDKGWTTVRTNGEVIGTIGESLRLEAIAIKCEGHHIIYRVHVEGSGWTEWIWNGEVAGTTGQEKRIEAIEIKLV